MDQHKDILIKKSLEKADEALKHAEISIKDNFICGAHNRIYYAIFYSVLALGYLEGFVTGKHRELEGWFNKTFIYEREVFDSSLYRLYKRIHDNRLKYDYDIIEIPTKEEAEKDLEEARAFINVISEYINSRIEKE